MEKTEDVIISDRFKDQNGNVVPFKIRALTQAENEAILRKSKRPNHKGELILDSIEYGRRLVVAATIFPPFESEEMCEKYGTKKATEIPSKMLLSGEYNKLTDAISQLSGFTDEYGNTINEDEIEAKN